MAGRDLLDVNLSRRDLTATVFANSSLYGATFDGAVLDDANFAGAALSGVRFVGCKLSRAQFHGARITSCDFSFATAVEANWRDAVVTDTTFSDATLEGSTLLRTSLVGCDFDRCCFAGAHLTGTTFAGRSFVDADFSFATLYAVSLTAADLTGVRGLGSVRHNGPSYIDVDVLLRYGSAMPRDFLLGIGLPYIAVEYLPSLLVAPIQFHSCFLSYNRRDAAFVDRLYADLRTNSVRVWRDTEELHVGDRLRVAIDEAILSRDKLIIVLSKNSIESGWVEKEVETALEREHKEHRDIVFPLMLDDAVMRVSTGWPADIRRARYIGDFTEWKSHAAYDRAFRRLLADLSARETSRHAEGERAG